jgi:predicted dehydrogenase
VDIVYNATTNNHHFENALAALWARKPMLMEKPICRSIAELDQLIEAHEKQPGFLMEAMWMRCFPIIRNLKQTLSLIEPLISMEASFGNQVPFDPNHRLFNPALGGGAMLDIGIYPLSLAHLILGLSDCEIKADVKRAETGVDDTVTVDLTYPGGQTAHLFCSFSRATPHRAVFKGQKGVLTIEDFFHPSKVTLTTADRHETLAEPEYPIMGYNFEIDEVHRALRAGETESPLMPLAHSREVLWVIERFLSTRSLRV